jgi:hypothetical protein
VSASAHDASCVSRTEKLAALAAIEAAVADPATLLGVLQEATDDEDALGRVGEAFELSPDQAMVVLDIQVRSFTPGRRAKLADELAVLRAQWGPPLEGRVHFSSRRSAVLTLDGAERRFTAGGTGGVLDLLHQHLFETVARPALREVVATVTGLPDGPTRMTVTPSGDGHFDHPG